MALYWIGNGPMPTTAAFAPVTTGTAIKTLLQLKPFNIVRIVEWGVSFDGSAAAKANVAGERGERRPQAELTHESETWSVAVLPTAEAKRELEKRHSSPRGWQCGRSDAMSNSRNPSETPRG